MVSSKATRMDPLYRVSTTLAKCFQKSVVLQRCTYGDRSEYSISQRSSSKCQNRSPRPCLRGRQKAPSNCVHQERNEERHSIRCPPFQISVSDRRHEHERIQQTLRSCQAQVAREQSEQHRSTPRQSAKTGCSGCQFSNSKISMSQSLTLITQKEEPNHSSPIILARPPIPRRIVKRRQPFCEHVRNVERNPKHGREPLVQQF